MTVARKKSKTKKQLSSRQNSSLENIADRALQEDSSASPFRAPITSQASILQITRQEHHSGPLPSSSELRGYANIDSSIPGRIIEMTEREQKHRHELETKDAEHQRAFIDQSLQAQTKFISRGQQFGLGLGLVSMGGGRRFRCLYGSASCSDRCFCCQPSFGYLSVHGKA